MSIKIAFIGAGSLGFTRTLVHDILTVPELRDTHFALHDIDPTNLDRITALLKRDVEANGLPAKIRASLDRREALKDADFVINSARIGGLEAFRKDVEIPLRYGVDQCVGDTLCAGGIFYGQRGIPVILDFCRDIRECAKPGVLFLNYGNPNAMLTWAANHVGKVRTLGLCHGVQGGHWQITSVIEHLLNKGRKRDSKKWVHVDKKEVDIICAGINHQTWYIQVRYKGESWTERLLEGFETHPEFRETEKVRIDMLRRFGYYSTESNGHLSEYVPWYRKRPECICDWISKDVWINGETGGYLRETTENRHCFDHDFPKLLQEEPWKLEGARRSEEHGSWIIESLVTGRRYRGHFNLINNGCITNLPDDCIVEVPCIVDGNGISVPKVGDLPAACAAICNQSIAVQRLSVEAAVAGNVWKLTQAMLLDPLVGAVCTTPEVEQLTQEMLLAEAKWLPQYAAQIPALKRAFSKAPKLARFPDYKGAFRKPCKKG